MRNFLLLIISTFIFSVSFANEYNGLNNPLGNEFQSDTNKVNFYELQKLKLYPIPASTHLYIDYNIIFVKEAKLQIYNSIGAIVFTKTLLEKRDKIKISVAEFENGLYFCSLKIDGNLLNTRKILINH